MVCGLDPLRDDGVVYHQALLDNGVRTKLEIIRGVPHGHMALIQLQSAKKAAMQFVQAIGWITGDEKSAEEASGAIREAL